MYISLYNATLRKKKTVSAQLICNQILSFEEMWRGLNPQIVIVILNQSVQPANTIHHPDAGPMLVRRLRRRHSIGPHWFDVSCLLGVCKVV